MKTKQLHCGQCATADDDKTEHVLIGFVPRNMFENPSTHEWINAAVCKSCGSLHAVPIFKREMDWAERRFLRALVDTDNMSEKEAKETLGLE